MDSSLAVVVKCNLKQLNPFFLKEPLGFTTHSMTSSVWVGTMIWYSLSSWFAKSSVIKLQSSWNKRLRNDGSLEEICVNV